MSNSSLEYLIYFVITNTGGMCFLHNMEKLSNFSEVLLREHVESNYQNGQYGDRMAKVCRAILFMEIL